MNRVVRKADEMGEEDPGGSRSQTPPLELGKIIEKTPPF